MKKALMLLALVGSMSAFAGVKECVLGAWDLNDVVARDKAMLKCFGDAKREFTTVEQCLWVSGEVTISANQDAVRVKCASLFEGRISFQTCLDLANSVDSTASRDGVKSDCIKSNDATLSAKTCLSTARSLENASAINKSTELCLGRVRADMNLSSCMTEADEVAAVVGSDNFSDELKINCVKVYGSKTGTVACRQAMEVGETVAPVVPHRVCCLKTVTELYLNDNKSKLEKRCEKL